MKIYNDSNKEYTVKNIEGEIVTLKSKGVVEVSDPVGEKLLAVRCYRGLRNFDELAGEPEKAKKAKAPKAPEAPEVPADLDKVE